MDQDFFPQGLALAECFCNRTSEQKRLKTDIQLAKPVLVTSPRRYGKTSLVLTVLQQLQLPFSHIDLYSELDEVDIQNAVLNAVGDILYSMESVPQKALQFVGQFFSELSVGFKFEGARIRVEFSKSQKSPANTVLTALQKLNGAVEKKKKKVVLFFDEFQRLGQISHHATLEGAIRRVAQESKSIAFIFSGSNRHLLSQMFDDRTKPLYKLCDRLVLERMTTIDYLPFIQDKAKRRWKKPLSETTLNEILSVTEHHPYYVNVLCHRLWLLDTLPVVEIVNATWHAYCLEEKSNVMNELDLLSHNQVRMLVAMAKYGDKLLPTSGEFMRLTQFSSSSATQALKILHQKDYLYINADNRYCILDPLIHYLFSRNG